MLLTILPIGVALLGWLPNDSLIQGGVLGIVAAGGGTALLAQIARDRGRRKQAELWVSWGGPPTTSQLRFRGTKNETHFLTVRAQLEQLFGDALPTEEEEAKDPAGADQRYEAVVARLREATRDTKRFPLVLAENINYGFRRNLWGLKPIGVTLAIVAAACSWALFFMAIALPLANLRELFLNPDIVFVTRLMGAVLNTFASVMWLQIVKPSWVRTTAEAYAERLFGSLESLSRSR